MISKRKMARKLASNKGKLVSLVSCLIEASALLNNSEFKTEAAVAAKLISKFAFDLEGLEEHVEDIDPESLSEEDAILADEEGPEFEEIMDLDAEARGILEEILEKGYAKLDAHPELKHIILNEDPGSLDMFGPLADALSVKKIDGEPALVIMQYHPHEPDRNYL